MLSFVGSCRMPSTVKSTGGHQGLASPVISWMSTLCQRSHAGLRPALPMTNPNRALGYRNGFMHLTNCSRIIQPLNCWRKVQYCTFSLGMSTVALTCGALNHERCALPVIFLCGVLPLHRLGMIAFRVLCLRNFGWFSLTPLFRRAKGLQCMSLCRSPCTMIRLLYC